MTNTLTKSIYLRAAPAKVWEYLTQPEKLATWFHKPTMALAEGEDYEKFGADSGNKMVWGHVTRMIPFTDLDYTFNIAPLGGVETTVSWRLSKVAGGTKLDLTHAGLPDGAEAFGLTLALDDGWDAHFGKLRTSANE
jgi:uncharacterized protein YndB with AHSA1/START domain